MFEYIFLGTVYPERVKFRCSLPATPISWPDLGVSGQFAIESLNSQLTIKFVTECNLLEHSNNDIFVTLKNLLGIEAKFIINVYCYFHSYNYDLDIYKVSCDKLGIDITFDVQLETDLEVRSEKETNELVSNIVSLSYSDNNLHFLNSVFEDFRKGIKYPEASGFYFYRSLDSIKANAFNGKWNLMNTALGIGEVYYQDLLPYRKKNAHGIYVGITGQNRIQFAKKTRKVIDAFITYMKDKNGDI